MRYILIALISVFSFASGSSVFVKPFAKVYNYSPKKSIKDAHLEHGFTFGGNFEQHLVEGFYSSTYIRHRDENVTREKDYMITYKFLSDEGLGVKVGLHNKTTDDNDLNDAIVGILGAKQQYESIKKEIDFTMGVDMYMSLYKNGHDDTNNKEAILVYQLSPYITYKNATSETFSNELTVQLNYIKTPMYLEKNYGFVRVSNTFDYSTWYLEVFGYLGEFKTAVFNKGYTIINDKNEYSKGYGLELGYRFNEEFKAKLNFTKDYIKEGVWDISRYGVYASINYEFSGLENLSIFHTNQ
jgi:hypothetical protein